MANPFVTNPNKAAAKIRINNNLIAVCLAMFTMLWAIAPEKLSLPLLLQFILAVPLLYVSSISYTKIAYWKDTRLWDYFGWFTCNTGTAFVLNIFGILTALLVYVELACLYFVTIWVLLAVYTLINLHCNPKAPEVKIFKLLYFVSIQAFFGIGILYL